MRIYRKRLTKKINVADIKFQITSDLLLGYIYSSMKGIFYSVYDYVKASSDKFTNELNIGSNL